MNKSSRLFLALWPDIKVQQAIQDWRDDSTWPSSASLVPRESLHLTLHFLGNVPDVRLPELAQELNVPFQAFDLSFSQFNMWPHGIVVLEPHTIPENLLQLHVTLASALQRLELPIEARQYHPHITLARHSAGATNKQRTIVQWHVQGYALVRSQLGSTLKSHSRYDVIQHFS